MPLWQKNKSMKDDNLKNEEINSNSKIGDSSSNNIIFQGNQQINSGGGNIIFGSVSGEDALPEEVKTKKAELRKTLKELFEELTKQQTGDNKQEDINNDKTDTTKDIQLLIRALKAERCVLFIGPEISQNAEGKSLHDEFYKALSADDINELEYNESEGFFQPHDDPMFEVDIEEYYNDKFNKENITGKNILQKLAQLPLKLIISFAPDETMHQIYDKYDKKHEFLHYKGTEIPDIKPETDNPVILNVLGSATSNGGKFIFTYNDFFKYLKNAKIPPEIKKEIQNAVHYVFIGFDFNRWNNRLLLFILGISDENQRSNRFLIEKEKTSEEIQSFMKKQFDISFVENDDEKFVNSVLKSAKKASLLNNLDEKFVEKQLSLIKKCSDDIVDAKKMEDLRIVEKDLLLISEKNKN